MRGVLPISSMKSGILICILNEVRLLSEEVTRGFYDFRRKVGAFIGAVACNEGYSWTKSCGNGAILVGKWGIFRSEFM